MHSPSPRKGLQGTKLRYCAVNVPLNGIVVMSFEFCNERLICKEIGIYQIKKAEYYDGHSETRGNVESTSALHIPRVFS